MKRNTFAVLFFIKRSQVKRTGLSSVMVRITINGEQVQFSCKIDVNPDCWNQKKQQVVSVVSMDDAFDKQYLDNITNP